MKTRTKLVTNPYCICYGKNSHGQSEMYEVNLERPSDRTLHIANSGYMRSLCDKFVCDLISGPGPEVGPSGVPAGSGVCEACKAKYKRGQQRARRS